MEIPTENFQPWTHKIDNKDNLSTFIRLGLPIQFVYYKLQMLVVTPTVTRLASLTQ